MAQAKKDNNGVPTMLAILDSDGVTPTFMQANASLNALKVHDGTTGTVTSSEDARRDGNVVTTMIVSSSGGTRVALAVNSSGQLLMQST